MKHSQQRPSSPASRARTQAKSSRFSGKSSHSSSEKRFYPAKAKARFEGGGGERHEVSSYDKPKRFGEKTGNTPFEKRFYPAKSKSRNHESFSDHGESNSYDKPKRSSNKSGHAAPEKRFYAGAPRFDKFSEEAGSRERGFSQKDKFKPKRPFVKEKKSFHSNYQDEHARPEQFEASSSKRYSSGKPRVSDSPEKKFRNKKSFATPKKVFQTGSNVLSSADLPSRENDILWGLHAVRAAWLNSKRKCFRLWLTESGQKAFASTLTEAEQNLLKRPTFKITDKSNIEQITPSGSVHQGIVLEAAPLHELNLHDVISGDHPADILLMLDQVTDPHNVGAILRSAAALGASAVIMTERNAPNTTGVLAKTASGAVEHVPQIHVVNLARTLDDLQQAGYWCVGLAEEGEKELSAIDLSSRVVLVLGAEGEGLRQLTRKKCNELARLPTGGPIGSLNVSNAAAVALYETRRQKSKFLK